MAVPLKIEQIILIIQKFANFYSEHFAEPEKESPKT